MIKIAAIVPGVAARLGVIAGRITTARWIEHPVETGGCETTTFSPVAMSRPRVTAAAIRLLDGDGPRALPRGDIVEAAGVGLPRSSNSRMLSRTRWAQSARNDRKPRC